MPSPDAKTISRHNTMLNRMMSDYGMAAVLLLLCVIFSVVTIKPQHPTGADAARRLSSGVGDQFDQQSAVLVVAGTSAEDVEFVDELRKKFARQQIDVLDHVNGNPSEVRRALERIVASGRSIDIVACNNTVATWSLVENLGDRFPSLATTQVVTPQSYRFPDFLKAKNLTNVAGQSAVFAIIAIGMTMVIISTGIDLSVGSLVALSAICCAMVVRDVFGGFDASLTGMMTSAAIGIGICGLIGAFSGIMITLFGIPPFIVTLAMMSVARGLAQLLAEGESIYQIPSSFSTFATGKALGLPNAVSLMLILYGFAHVIMTRTTWGRYIYAVGGNREAARLSGVPVRRVLLSVYAICGALAGVGGIIEASRLGSGSPLYGQMYELYVIAAVVVGGTSLSGGEGKILSTLIGALIIAVIRNGMNLMNIESYTQGVVMGLLILTAVLIDMTKKRGWRLVSDGTS